jgi:hypothetical protein
LIGFGTVSAAALQARKTPDVWFYRYDHINEDVTFLDMINSMYNFGLHSIVSKTSRAIKDRVARGEYSIVNEH